MLEVLGAIALWMSTWWAPVLVPSAEAQVTSSTTTTTTTNDFGGPTTTGTLREMLP